MLFFPIYAHLESKTLDLQVISRTTSMETMKFDLEKFTGKKDFELCRIMMRALLVEEGLQDALLGDKNLTSIVFEKEKYDLWQKAHNMLILSIDTKVLREVAKEESIVDVRLNLEHLYMTKLLTHRLYKKTRFYTFKMVSSVSIEEHLYEFNYKILDHANIDITIDDEDRAILLLCSLDASCTNLKETTVYSRENLTLEEIQFVSL